MEWLRAAQMWWPSVKAWMETNDKLAGWAQAFGAVIALLVAIGVPAWQRYSEKRAVQIADANSDAALAQSLFYLLRDVELFIARFTSARDVPRKMLLDPVTMDDLLSRIAALESREEKSERVTALFRARGALTGVRMAFADWLWQLPFDEGDVSLMETRVALLKEFGEQANIWVGDALYRREIAKRFFLARLVAPLIRRPVERGIDWWQSRKCQSAE